MTESSVYALKVNDEWAQSVYESLLKGEGRFGWSYAPTADLFSLKEKVDAGQWNVLSDAEQDCYIPLLLELAPGDHVVYVNAPEWGRCTVARVVKPYYWRWEDSDFNHRFGVDPASVTTFDRNDAIVHPALRARLKLQGRHWRIYLRDEFQSLLEALRQGKGGLPATERTGLVFLGEDLGPILNQITERIHHNHPNYGLEALMEEVLKRVPGVKEVIRQGGAGDQGADLLLTVSEGFPAPGLYQEKRGVVQVKSYANEHWDTRAVFDIERAFEAYPDASFGLIISSATSSTKALEDELEALRERIPGKPVGLLIGKDVAGFVLRYAPGVILDHV